jgi:hypothetical protein
VLFVRALLVGGNVNNGRNAGARYCNVNNTPGNANWNIGAAHSCVNKNITWRFLSHATAPEGAAGFLPVQKLIVPDGVSNIHFVKAL